MKQNIEKIKSLLISGKTYQEVGEIFGVSKQRIEQIKKQYFPTLSKQDFGSGFKTQQKLLIQIEKIKERYNRDSFYFINDLERIKVYKLRLKKFNNLKKRIPLKWDLDFPDIFWPTHCPVLGIELDYFADFRQENSISFDRIDPFKGYIKGNVSVISWRANRIKNDGTAEEHIKIAEYIKSYQNN